MVVIPCLNVEGTLPRQLAALDAQTDLRFRVVISDNGSTDGTRRVAEQWRPAFQGIEIVDSSSLRGVANARNVAIRASTEELILICDADDRVHPGWVAAMRRALTIHPAVTGPLVIIRPERPELREVWNADRVPRSMNYLPYMPGGNLGIRRVLLEEVGGFDSELDRGQEDVDFGWRISIAGHVIGHAPDAAIDYFQRPGLRNYLRQQNYYGRAYVALYLKHRHEPIPVASWKSSLRWFIEWAKLLPVRVRQRQMRDAFGAAVFQAARLTESIRCRTRTPL